MLPFSMLATSIFIPQFSIFSMRTGLRSQKFLSVSFAQTFLFKRKVWVNHVDKTDFFCYILTRGTDKNVHTTSRSEKMITDVILSVSESKRLIAKGVAKLPSVQKVMEVGGQSPMRVKLR